MSWFTGIIVYLMVWWLALFAVLPWGNAPVLKPEEGHAPSAPAKPRLRLKFLATTILSAMIWVVIYFLIENEIIDLYGAAEDMVKEDRDRR